MMAEFRKNRIEELRMNQEVQAPALRTGGNENTGLIKIFAIAFMIVDHLGVVFFPGCREMRLIGRIALPLFAWCMCVGAEYTRNIWLYALRLLAVGLIAQPCFMLGLNHQWYELNVYATLLCGLLGIAAIRENRFGSRYWGPVLAMLIPCVVKMDYSWQGVLFILLLYGCRKQRASIAALMAAFCLYWGYGTFTMSSVFGIPVLQQVSFLPNANGLFKDISRVQFWAILAVPLMILPMKSRLRLPKWMGYAAYPVHLLAIGVIRHWGEISGWLSQWL